MSSSIIIRKEDRNIGIITSAVILVLMFLLFFFVTYSIPDPPLESVPVMAETELEEIELKKYIVQTGQGGGGSGTPVKAPVINRVVEQTQKVLTSKNGSTTVPKGGSNHTNSNTPNNNPSSTTQESTNYFGSGGTGGGNNGGIGNGLGNDTGDGEGDGNGPKKGGDVRRYLVERPNTNNFKSDEFCKIVLRVQVDEDGTIVGKPQFVKAASTTNNTTLVNQVIYAVQNQAKFNKAKGTKIMSQVITIEIQAS